MKKLIILILLILVVIVIFDSTQHNEQLSATSTQTKLCKSMEQNPTIVVSMFDVRDKEFLVLDNNDTKEMSNSVYNNTGYCKRGGIGAVGENVNYFYCYLARGCEQVKDNDIITGYEKLAIRIGYVTSNAVEWKGDIGFIKNITYYNLTLNLQDCRDDVIKRDTRMDCMNANFSITLPYYLLFY